MSVIYCQTYFVVEEYKMANEFSLCGVGFVCIAALLIGACFLPLQAVSQSLIQLGFWAITAN
ncbi:hypothetical protein [Polaribacter sp. SA4-10]|uniref:hypothetical protein n=1 Tax=Polaribacter sp. SA4-10 TaxID=754397 RepID=UPI0012FC83FF|nr:hypothetical protein [Polaribacter sp. SA4-10]